MNIAFDAKRFFHNSSGLGNYSRDLVRILAEFYPDNKYLLLAQRESNRGHDLLKLPSVSFVPVIGKFARQWKAGKIAQHESADIFHGLSGELPVRWNARPIVKIVTIHDLIFLRYPRYYSWFDRVTHYRKFKAAAYSADVVIAISEQTKKDIVHFLKVSESKIQVVYQGCHPAFKSEIAREELNKIAIKHNLPERFILSVGTVEERKNLLSAVRAIADTEIPLVVVGRETKYAQRVHRFLGRHKMQGRVHFLQNVSMTELAALYRLADVFVYPSFFEGFGIPVIEALFSGTATITSNRSSLPEAGGPHSLYVDPENVADLSAKIKFLWENPAERERRAQLSSAFVQKFTDERIARSLMAVYEKAGKIAGR